MPGGTIFSARLETQGSSQGCVPRLKHASTAPHEEGATCSCTITRECRRSPCPPPETSPSPWLADHAPRPRAERLCRRRQLRSGSRGQALVELALVTPILLLLLLAAIDLGRVYYAQISVENAAREAALVASSSPGGFVPGSACDAATNPVMCAATREGQGGAVTVSAADVAMTCTPSCSRSYGNTLTVTVTGHFTLLTPVLWIFTGGPEVTFSKSATADIIVTPTAAGLPAPTPTPAPSPTPTATPPAGTTPSPAPTASPTPTPAPTCPPPMVAFNATQQKKNEPVNFTSTSTPTSGPCAISYWRWDYGDGSYDAGNFPTAAHSYASQKTQFWVTLTVTTPSGTFPYTAPVTTK